MKPPSSRAIAIGVLVVLVPFGLLLATQIGADRGARELIDEAVPNFELPVLDGDGEMLSSAELQGTTYLVNFWNDWCIPCIQEHPSLAQFHAAHANDSDVRLIGIVRDENSVDDIRRYVAREGVEWTILLDPDGVAKVGFRTTGQPETFAVGPDGVVREVFIGPASYEELEALADIAQARAEEKS
jgi:cytochrome c biogenesis protein CcmG, thiol:disulfide interchange protein DsbE